MAKEQVMRVSLTACRAGLGAVVCTVLIGVFASPVATAATSPSTPRDGQWQLLRAAPGVSSEAHARPNSLPGGDGSSCPRGTYAYSGTNAKWNCLSVSRDHAGTGHAVWIRQGASGTSGFGYLHALIDHNVDESTIEAIIYNSAAGIAQSNGRYLYGAVYRQNGKPIEYVNVYEQRTKGGGSPDANELGVVTAYCSSTFTSSEPKSKCPDWVNATL